MRWLILAALLSACGKPDELATSRPQRSLDGSTLVLDDAGLADEPCAIAITSMPEAPNDPLPQLDNTNGWKPVAPLHVARYRPFTELLPDGRVLIAGGSYSRSPTTGAVETYDPARDAWTVEAEWPATDPTVGMAMLDAGKFVELSSASTAREARLRVLELSTHTWSVLAASPRSISGGSTLTRLNNGELLLVGGAAYSDSSPWRAFRFDPRRNAWRPAASMRFGRIHHRASLLGDGRVVVIGGHEPDAAPLETYDPVRDEWTTPTLDTIEGDTARWDYSLAWVAGRRIMVPASPSSWSDQVPIRTFDLDCGQTDAVVYLPGRVDAYTPLALQTGDAALIGGETRALDQWGTKAYATLIVSHLSVRPRFLAPLPELRHEPIVVRLKDGAILAFGGAEDASCASYCDLRPEAWILRP